MAGLGGETAKGGGGVDRETRIVDRHKAPVAVGRRAVGRGRVIEYVLGVDADFKLFAFHLKFMFRTMNQTTF